ncbi:MAG: hypothetical protein HFF17_07500 [Oscillospiraceae bacterium]|nr:hypothetical protein [Oscillospiraceae bacterium]
MSNEEKILEILEQHGRILEKHGEILEKQGAAIGQIQKDLTSVAVTQENVVLPQLRLLAEGQQTILDTLAPKDRVEALEGDVSLLKELVRSMSQRIAALEAAQ